MANLKLSRRERETQTMVDDDEQKDTYPYGLIIRLEEEELNKLSLGLKQVGQECEFTIAAVVTNVSREPGEVGGERSMTLQITDMEVLNGQEPSAADRLYKTMYKEG